MYPLQRFIDRVVSSANASANVTKASVAGRFHYLTGIVVGVSGAASAGDTTVIVSIGGVSTATFYVPPSSRGNALALEFTDPIQCGPGKALAVDVAAAGAGAVTTTVIKGYTK